ncbi:MAG TPA: hypothetical protein VJ224_01455 [Thermoplasmata archaeon]|nr:hypothetical protein [Thermoplasmata archaeon]
MPMEEGVPTPDPEKRKADPREPPAFSLELEPGFELTLPIENELTPLDEMLLQSLVESADYAKKKAKPGELLHDYSLSPPEAIVDAFRTIWDKLALELSLNLSSAEALKELRDLVIYDIPDGTRSTLTVPPMMDVDLDAGMFCLALVHTLKSLGSRRAVLMTHTAYNRSRGPEDTRRILNVVAKAVEPVAQYARRHRIRLHLIGQTAGYELGDLLTKNLEDFDNAPFDAHFLVDYAEELFLSPEGQQALATLPNIDVCVRHTKLQVSGGWVPTKMLKCSYVYSQNGSLFSNWTYDEYAALAAVCLLSKKLMSGEILNKAYLDIDDVKRRYQLRELSLFQKSVRLREEPRKLFVVGSPIGLYQIYY